jgi:hypothetical protein
MVESIGAQFGLIYTSWAAACGVILAAIALHDYRTINSAVPGTAAQPMATQLVDQATQGSVNVAA